MQLDPAELAPAVNRLRRAQGQLAGVLRMIEEGRDCAEIVTQISAVSKAVDRAGFAIIATGMERCLAAGESGRVDRDKLERLFLSLA